MAKLTKKQQQPEQSSDIIEAPALSMSG